MTADVLVESKSQAFLSNPHLFVDARLSNPKAPVSNINTCFWGYQIVPIVALYCKKPYTLSWLLLLFVQLAERWFACGRSLVQTSVEPTTSKIIRFKVKPNSSCSVTVKGNTQAARAAIFGLGLYHYRMIHNLARAKNSFLKEKNCWQMPSAFARRREF